MKTKKEIVISVESEVGRTQSTARHATKSTPSLDFESPGGGAAVTASPAEGCVSVWLEVAGFHAEHPMTLDICIVWFIF